MARSKKQPDFEQSIAQLEEIVEALEAGDLTLEQSLKHYEQGVALTRGCQDALSQAEQTIKVLSEKNGEPLLRDLDLDTSDSE